MESRRTARSSVQAGEYEVTAFFSTIGADVRQEDCAINGVNGSFSKGVRYIVLPPEIFLCSMPVYYFLFENISCSNTFLVLKHFLFLNSSCSNTFLVPTHFLFEHISFCSNVSFYPID